MGAKGGRSKKMETTVNQSNRSIFHKSLDLLISSILNNNNNDIYFNFLIHMILNSENWHIFVAVKILFFALNAGIK